MCQTRPSYCSFSARTSSFLRTRVTFIWASPLVSWSRAPLLLPPASLALSSLSGYIPVSCLLAHASFLFSSCPASPNCQRPAGGPASAVEAQLAQQACRVPATSSLALLHFPVSPFCPGSRLLFETFRCHTEEEEHHNRPSGSGTLQILPLDHQMRRQGCCCFLIMYSWNPIRELILLGCNKKFLERNNNS